MDFVKKKLGFRKTKKKDGTSSPTQSKENLSNTNVKSKDNNVSSPRFQKNGCMCV